MGRNRAPILFILSPFRVRRAIRGMADFRGLGEVSLLDLAEIVF
jgi:hypothetical protein